MPGVGVEPHVPREDSWLPQASGRSRIATRRALGGRRRASDAPGELRTTATQVRASTSSSGRRSPDERQLEVDTDDASSRNRAPGRERKGRRALRAGVQVQRCHTVVNFQAGRSVTEEEALEAARTEACQLGHAIDQMETSVSTNLEHAMRPDRVDPGTGIFVPLELDLTQREPPQRGTYDMA